MKYLIKTLTILLLLFPAVNILDVQKSNVMKSNDRILEEKLDTEFKKSNNKKNCNLCLSFFSEHNTGIH